MNREEIFDIITEIIEEVADIPRNEIHLEDSIFEDIDLSSLEIMAIVGKITKKLNVSIKEMELIQIQTIEDLVLLLEKKV